MRKRKPISFSATKRKARRVKISFNTKRGPVTFAATRRVPKKIKVDFYGKRKK